jgi:hypothetical protein
MKKLAIVLGVLSLFACNNKEQESKDKIKEIQRLGDSTQKYFDAEIIKSQKEEIKHLENAIELKK